MSAIEDLPGSASPPPRRSTSWRLRLESSALGHALSRQLAILRQALGELDPADCAHGGPGRQRRTSPRRGGRGRRRPSLAGGRGPASGSRPSASTSPRCRRAVPGHPHPRHPGHEEPGGRLRGRGFTVAQGLEVETEWHNFGALNFLGGHPACEHVRHALRPPRPAGVDDAAHPHLARAGAGDVGHEPPFYSVMPPRVFRSDTADATHMPVFHQIEGLVADRDITFADLAGHDRRLHQGLLRRPPSPWLRPAYFPFTEPSAEFDIHRPDGSRMELGGCGMVHPNVLANCGIDPEEGQGFAFGFGIDRLAIARHGVDDLRDLSAQRHPLPEPVLAGRGTDDEGLLSWLRDSRPDRGRPGGHRRTISDLGTPSRPMDPAREGLGGNVVARVLSTRPHPNADKIQRSTSTARRGPADRLRGLQHGRGRPGGAGDRRHDHAGRHGDQSAQGVGRVVQRHVVLGPRRWAGTDHAGIFILPEGLTPGMEVTEALGIEPDVLYDLEVNPNWPDAMSIAGWHDLAARLGVPFTPPPVCTTSCRRPAPSSSRSPTPTCAAGSPAALRRRRRRLARLRRPAAHAHGHAADQLGGRRLELRDARAGPAQPRLRPGQGGGAAAGGPGVSAKARRS